MYISNKTIRFNLDAFNPDGAIIKAFYLIDGVRIATKEIGDFAFDWLATPGTHEVKAGVLENHYLDTIFTTSTPFTVHERDNIKPTISILAPHNGRAHFYPKY